jgi:hypothetical protein
MIHKNTDSESSVVPIRREGKGYAADGPGFYIWDEDLGEVLRMARELAHGSVRLTSTARFLQLREFSEAP